MQLIQDEMSKTVSWTFFGAIFLLALGLRVINLGGPDFGIDEILHIYAAKGLIEEGTPMLPGDILYSRALTYTKLVAIVGELWGLNEWTARLPSVFFGLLTVWLTFLIGRYWYSNGVGLTAAFLVAVIPVEIIFSRSVRMYSMFQLFFLAIIFLFFYGFESNETKEQESKIPKKSLNVWTLLEVRPFVLLLAAVLILFIQEIHILILPAMIGPLAYIFVMALGALGIGRLSYGCKVKYGASVILIVLTAISVYVFNQELYETYLYRAQFVPDWARDENVENWLYYRDSLALRYPIVFGTFLFGGLLGLARRPKLTMYLILCFIAPLLLSSLLFSWKAYRYIFHLLPLLFILFSIGFCELIVNVYRLLVEEYEIEVNQLVARGFALTLIVGGIVFSLQSVTWFNQGIRYHQDNVGHVDGVRYNNWEEAMMCVSRNSNSSDVLITPWPLLSKYYGPARRTYVLNDVIPAQHNKQFLAEATAIEGLEDLKNVVQKNPSGLLVADRVRFYHFSRSIPLVVRDWVSTNFTEISCQSAADMVVWKWDRG